MRVTIAARDVAVGDLVEMDNIYGVYLIRVADVEHRVGGVKLSGLREGEPNPGRYSWGKGYDETVVRID